MGVAGKRCTRTLEIMVAGGDAAEKKDYEGQIREAYIMLQWRYDGSSQAGLEDGYQVRGRHEGVSTREVVTI